MMSLKRAKKANVSFKNAVFGFVREHEKKKSIAAPEIVKYLILNYYLLTDKFREHGDGVQVKEECIIVASNPNTLISNGPCSSLSAFGDIETGDKNEGIDQYEWTLRVNLNNKRFSRFFVGLTLDPTEQATPTAGLPFGTSGIGILPNLKVAMVINSEGRFYPLKWKSDEKCIIRMRLSVGKKELSFYGNEQFIFKMGESDGFEIGKFRLFVSLRSNVNTLELIDFAIKHK